MLTITIATAPRGGSPLTITLPDRASYADMSAAFCALRDRLDAGASEFAAGIVTDGAGEVICRITYNGRVWLPEGDLLLGRSVYDPPAYAAFLTRRAAASAS